MTVVTPASTHKQRSAIESVNDANGAANEAATATNWTRVLTLLERVGYTSAEGREISKYLKGMKRREVAIFASQK